MPKFYGVSVLGILIATVVFHLLGALWYGMLFTEQWMNLSKITEEMVVANNEKLGIMMWIWGILITLFQVIGIAIVINLVKANKLVSCVNVAVHMAVLFALPVLAYGSLYSMSSIHLLGINFLHMLIGYCLSAGILSFFRS